MYELMRVEWRGGGANSLTTSKKCVKILRMLVEKRDWKDTWAKKWQV
jgi:hypothetical protein